MAEEEKEEFPGIKPLDHPGITTHYANETHIMVNSGDVALYFGVRDESARPDSYHPYQKIIIPHAIFMKMVEFWATRYRLLFDIYGEIPKTLNDFPAEVVKKAFDELLLPQESTKDNK